MVTLIDFVKAKSSLLLPLALCVLAFGLRYHFLTAYPYPLMIHEQDGVAYMDLARQMLETRLQNYTLPPFYPAVIALFSFLPVSFESAARLASVTMDALTVIPLCYLAGKFLSPVGRYSVGILWAFCAFSLYFTVSPLSQSSYLCCLMAGIAFLYRGLEEERGEVWLFVSGVCLAFAYQARIEGIIGFVGGLLLCLFRFFDKGENIRRKIRSISLYAAGFLAAAGPYLVLLRSRVGYWTISIRGEQELKTPDVVNTLNAAGTVVKSTARGIALWTKNFGSFPEFMSFVGTNIKEYCAVYLRIFPFWMHLLVVSGVLLLIVVKGRRRACYLVLLLAVITPIVFLNIPKTPSYFYPAFPLTFICLMVGVEGVITGIGYAWCKITKAPLSPVWKIISFCLLVLPVAVLVPRFYADADGNFQDPGLVQEAALTERIYKDAGVYIKNNSSEGEPVITRWGLVSYYADRPLIILPKGQVQEVVNFARQKGARYMVIDSVAVYSRRQELAELLNPLMGKAIDTAYGLQVFHTKVDGDLGQGYVIFKVM